jgi:hypothetical protein
MSKKFIAAVLVAAVAIGLFAAYRTTNRADAAAGNCYSDAKGPSEPTVCS